MPELADLRASRLGPSREKDEPLPAAVDDCAITVVSTEAVWSPEEAAWSRKRSVSGMSLTLSASTAVTSTSAAR